MGAPSSPCAGSSTATAVAPRASRPAATSLQHHAPIQAPWTSTYELPAALGPVTAPSEESSDPQPAAPVETTAQSKPKTTEPRLLEVDMTPPRTREGEPASRCESRPGARGLRAAPSGRVVPLCVRLDAAQDAARAARGCTK